MSSLAYIPLGDIAPARPLGKPDTSVDDDIWQLNLDQVESETGRVLEKEFVPSSATGVSTHCFDERHVLYSKLRPYLNKVVLPDQAGACTTELVPLLPDEERLDRRYLAYYLRSKLFVDWISAQVAGAKMPRVSMDVFWNHKIPVPHSDDAKKSLLEQKRIATILDKADSIRRKRHEAISMADEFLKSVFLDMFGDPVTNPKGWPVKRLDDIALSFQNGIGKGKDFYGRGVKVANIGDLYEKPYFKPDKYSLLEVSDDEIERYKLVTGDLLFVRSSVKREGVAYCSAYDSEEICLFSSFMIRVKLIGSEVNSKFISVQMRTKGIHDALVKASNTSTHTNINQAGLSGINVIVPPIKLQEQFVSISDKVVECLNGIYLSDKNIVDCSESLSQKAFAGEL